MSDNRIIFWTFLPLICLGIGAISYEIRGKEEQKRAEVFAHANIREYTPMFFVPFSPTNDPKAKCYLIESDGKTITVWKRKDCK